MSTNRYAAFISYSSRYADWVHVFHKHIETCLEYAGNHQKVFLDKLDLGIGHSWVNSLHKGLVSSDRLVVVATPEAMASPRVGDEWEVFVSKVENWRQGRLLVVHLVDTPLPQFLSLVQQVDFRQHDGDIYLRRLRELLAALLGLQDRRELPKIPSDLEPPKPPKSGWPSTTRKELIDWLAPFLKLRAYRYLISEGLGWKRDVLDTYVDIGPAYTASAALVRFVDYDDPIRSGLHLLDILEKELKDDWPEKMDGLASLRQGLEDVRQSDTDHDLLYSWLRSVVADHDSSLPYFPQLIEPTLLDRVYVPLEIRSEIDVHSLYEGGTRAPCKYLDIREILSLNPEEHPWVTGRWIIRGEPGAGKTTILRHLALTLARESDPPWIPVFEPLPQLLRETDFLFNRLTRRLERAGHQAQTLPAALSKAGREGRLLLLLDGLDEVPQEFRSESEALLRDLAARWPRSPIVVATRSLGFRSPSSEFRELEVLPLDCRHRREFLARWLDRSCRSQDEARTRADEQLAILKKTPTLWKLTENPFYLTLIALLFDKDQELSRRVPQIYDQVIDLLLEGRPGGAPISPRLAIRRILRYLAYGMTVDNRETESVGVLEDRLYKPEVASVRERILQNSRWRENLRLFLDDVANRTGILGPYDGPNADWRFWHRALREALTAEYLEERFNEDGKRAIENHARSVVGKEGRWAEPYALLAGRMDDRDTLLRILLKENRVLSLHAVATAQGLADDTLRDILELSEKWEDRSQIYRQLPDLIDDPERTLTLLDRLRKAFHDGNDLYFIDLAVSKVGNRWPEYRGQADRIRLGLYDHIRAPDEALFRWVDTPVDGRVPMWQEIPAGTFRMGSIHGESRWSDERPRHEVILTQPFSLASVPVTSAQYSAFDPKRKGVETGFPMTGVTWFAAVSFCRWLAFSFKWARGARLPTEEEWEYACRAGTETRYWSGDRERDLGLVGWYLNNSGNRIHRLGEKPANPLGLYDIHGNIWEWTLGRFDGGYESRGPVTVLDTQVLETEAVFLDDGVNRRVFRGGSAWLGADYARAAMRDFRTPEWRYGDLGFRVLIPSRP